MKNHITAAVVFGAMLATTAVAHTATLPPGFYETLVASGLTRPTAMQFAPDGRLFVCEQGGTVRVIKDGALLPIEFVSIAVDSVGFAGLLGVAFDPNFATTQFVYVYYTTATQPRHNRIGRLTANGDVAEIGSEVTIFDLDDLSPDGHHGGAIHFGLDGKLYVGVGDNDDGAHAQSLENVFGKILRINPDGTIPPDNPFFDTAIGNNRAIWALGFRNPFTLAVQPTSGKVFINDVGESSWEEINEGVAGANYGWPQSEGPASVPFTSPIHSYQHGSGPTRGCAITGGTFYNPTTPQFPVEYVGQYFFADYCAGWIRRLDPSQSNATSEFVTHISNPVDLKVGPDGGLYYLARGSEAVYRILAAPAGTFVLTANMSGSGTGAVTSDPGHINCPGTCTDALASSTIVALTAAADVGSTFIGWSGVCSGSGGCSVTMNAAQSVTATFMDQRDFVVTAVTDPPAAALPGTTFNVSDTTANQGLTGAPESTTRFLLSSDTLKSSGDVLLTGSRVVPALGPGANSTALTAVTVPSTMALGSYFILACADDLAEVPEADDANNCRAATNPILVQRPDLVETVVSTPSTAVAPGGALSIIDTAHNQGPLEAGSSTTRYYLSVDVTKSTNDLRFKGSRAVPLLAPGTSSSGNNSLKVPSSTPLGTHYLLACADDLLKVKESNDANNCVPSAVTVLIALPDLVTSAVTDPPASAVRGGRFTIDDTVENLGATPSNPSTTRYYLSLDGQKDFSDVLLQGARSVASLAPNASSEGSRKVTVPATTPFATYVVLACADDLAKVDEADNANNCGASAITVTIRP